MALEGGALAKRLFTDHRASFFLQFQQVEGLEAQLLSEIRYWL